MTPTRPEDDAFERLRRAERAIEEQLREAADRGELSGLPGEGAPLPPDADEAAGDRWAAAHVLRNANAVPEWADLRTEIRAARERLVRRIRAHREWLGARTAGLRRLPAERILESVRTTEELDRRFRDDLAGAIAEVNAKIARHNLLVRVPLLQLVPLDRGRLDELASRDE